MVYTAEMSNMDSLQEDTENVSVSDLLSSFYNVDDNVSQGDRTDGNGETQENGDDVMFSSTVFGQKDFSAESCLNAVLRKYSLLDLIALLRRLEREVRQFTAGKQLLIYDNYECLFTALDTVHEINTELTVVQKHLQALKASQIKASSIDISSRDGIRDKLVRVSELNRLLNIFQVLRCIANCLKESKKRVTSISSNKEDVIELLDIVTNAHLILKAVQERAWSKARNIQLLHTFEIYIRDVLPSVMVSVHKLIKSEHLLHDELITICTNLARSHLFGKQVWEYYWLNKSLIARNMLVNLAKAVNSPTITLYKISNDIVDFILYISEGVNSDGFIRLSRCLEDNKCQNAASGTCEKEGFLTCIFCIDGAFELLFLNEEGTVEANTEFVDQQKANNLTYAFYNVAQQAKNNCKCMREHLPQQFVSLFVQYAFAALQYRVMNCAQKATTNEVIFVLSSILDRIKVIRKEESLVKTIIDISYRWMLLILLNYIQKQFYPAYKSVIDSVLSHNEEKGKDIFRNVESQVEEILKEDVTESLTFVEDMSNAMHSSLRPVFSSFIMLYIIYMKTAFRKLFKVVISSYALKQEKVNYLCSLSSLISARGNSKTISQVIVSEHLDITRENVLRVLEGSKTSLLMTEGNEVDPGLVNTIEGLSVELYQEHLIKDKVDLWSSTDILWRSTLTKIVVLMYNFNAVLGRVSKAAIEKLGRASMLVTSGDLQMALPKNYHSSPSYIKIKQNICLSEELEFIRNVSPLERLFADDLIHLTAMVIKIHGFHKEESRINFPLHDLSKERYNVVNTIPQVEYTIEEDFFDIAQGIVSLVMNSYIRTANRLIRSTMENIEAGHNTLEAAIKDFTGMMYDMIEFLNATSEAAAVDEETQRRIVGLHRRLNEVLSLSDMASLNSIHEFPFVPSKELCLKLFTIQIAQIIARNAQQHVLSGDHLREMLSRIEMQLLVAFRKSTDIDQMKRTFGILAYPDLM